MNLNDIPKELIDIVSKSAPILGSILGSPLAGIGISLLSNLFNSRVANTPISIQNIDDLLQTIKGDPEANIKIKTLEFNHEESLKQIASQNYNEEVTDRISARQFDEHNPMVVFLVILLFCSIGLILYCLLKINVPSDIKTVLVMVLTALIREIPDIYRLYFGATDDKN